MGTGRLWGSGGRVPTRLEPTADDAGGCYSLREPLAVVDLWSQCDDPRPGEATQSGSVAPSKETALASLRAPVQAQAGSIAARRIAILDDDPSVLRTVGKMARRLGMEVRTCSSLAEFEMALEGFDPNMLLIDLMMPDLDGIDVVRRIGPRPQTSLFVMSGADQRTCEASREVLAASGARVAGFLHKPFTAADLARTLACAMPPPRPLLAQRSVRPLDKVLAPSEFEQAVLTGQVEPFYQPIFHADGRTLKGFEALARISGVPSPGFPPEYLNQLALDRGLSATLTDHVIRRALRFMAHLPASCGDLSISINLFGDYAVADGFREWLTERCARTGVARNRVILELSETTVFNFGDDDLRKITQLRLAGFGLSIDDFGTGYSSLGRLASLPFSELKIDKAFCLALPQSQPAAAVIEACLGLASRLGMKVIAEGVEGEDVAAVLASMGCDALQGHLFGQAMAADEVVHWLSGSPPRRAA